jgi:predicted Holliday junction resolvase-like endonuclease
MIAALIVVVLWVIILALYLLVARRQQDVQAQLKALDEQLKRSEREGGQG